MRPAHLPRRRAARPRGTRPLARIVLDRSRAPSSFASPHAAAASGSPARFERVGCWRFLDVLAFRLHYRLVAARADREWERRELERLRARVSCLPGCTGDDRRLAEQRPRQSSSSASSSPDLVIARCKTLLKEQVFSIPPLGTFVMHPGICPEYRNAHGCFWARATGDDGNVGMTLLRIDRGRGHRSGLRLLPRDARTPASRTCHPASRRARPSRRHSRHAD